MLWISCFIVALQGVLLLGTLRCRSCASAADLGFIRVTPFFKSREPILRKWYLSTFIHINKHMDGARDIFWIKSLNGTFLALQIKAFGPKIFWFSCAGKKVPFWQFLKILKNCQNGTFLPMHENQNFFGPNAFIWSARKVPFSDFIQNMSLAPSMCLFMWIKVDK